MLELFGASNFFIKQLINLYPPWRVNFERNRKMNKKEIEKELVRARAAEITIKNNIIELLEQLVEAEKPKLRHGDFGPNKEGNNRIVLYQNGTSTKGENLGRRDDYCCMGLVLDSNIKPLGNIFDLLKEWSEDLEEFEVKGAGCAKFKARIACDKDSIILTVFDGNKSSPIIISIPEAEEIWHKLGRIIATLKKTSPRE